MLNWYQLIPFITVNLKSVYFNELWCIIEMIYDWEQCNFFSKSTFLASPFIHFFSSPCSKPD